MSVPLTRHLATVMFSDMMGYSHLMTENESRALQLRNKMERILREITPLHDGQIIQYYGDGALSLFSSSVQAVRCAEALQEKFQEEPPVQVRIGLHVGDVAVDDNGAYGDSVNIASRIESFAVPGGVFLSEKVYDDIRNHPEIKVVSMGKFRLKNILDPMGIYALRGKHLKVPPADLLQGKGQRLQKTIAVLPFLNMSSDPENEYFSEGISEEILNALAKVNTLQVTARTSSFHYKDRNLDVREIGKKLGVECILEGSVRKAGKRVRITAQLVDTEKGFHIFSETYDRTLEDIFDVQDEIARTITAQLLRKLGLVSEDDRMVRQATDNMEAYQDFLKGNYYWNRYSPQAAKKAVAFYHRATGADPDFAKAWAYLSYCYSYLGATGYMPGKEVFPLALEAGAKALSLDDQISEAHCAMGAVELFYHWDIPAAEKSLMRARATGARTMPYVMLYALLLRAMGRFSESVERLEAAVRLDPVSVLSNSYLAEGYMVNRQYQKALQQADKVLDLFPVDVYARKIKAWALLELENYEGALQVLDEANPAVPAYLNEIHALQGVAYARSGQPKKALRCAESLKKLEPEAGAVIHESLALVYSELGDMKSAFQHFFAAVDNRVGGLIFTIHHPGWEKIRKEEPYQQFLKMIKVYSD